MARIQPHVFATPEALGDAVAAGILARIDRANDSRRRLLLGFPTGRTPRPVFAALASQLAALPRDLSRVTLVMMDEYLVPHGDSLVWAPDDAPWACHHYARVEIMDALNPALPANRRLQAKSIWFPDPADPGAYDTRIADAGGIDWFLLASGASDGHVAFNQPGAARDTKSRVVPLSEPTRRDNLKTHPGFGSLENVPTAGVTVGIATIAAAKSASLVLWGAGKRETFRRVVAAEHYEPDWPATVIHEVQLGEIIADTDAAAA